MMKRGCRAAGETAQARRLTGQRHSSGVSGRSKVRGVSMTAATGLKSERNQRLRQWTSEEPASTA